jgi:hypothetical protein
MRACVVGYERRTADVSKRERKNNVCERIAKGTNKIHAKE